MKRVLRIGKRKFTYSNECTAQEAMLPALMLPLRSRDVLMSSENGEVWNKMAVGSPAVRVEESLRIKIGEAKNLPPHSHVSSCCAISLDQEEIFRTATLEKTSNPYYGEEFKFEIPRQFRFLSLYIYDRDRHMKQDKVIGKVAIKKEELHKYHGKDHWFPLVPVDADSEVQGKVHVQIKCDQIQVSKSKLHCDHFKSIPCQLSVRVIECNDLTINNGACDPYANVTFICEHQKIQTKSTKVAKKTICPKFEEKFCFEWPNKTRGLEKELYIMENTAELHIILYHESSAFGNVFLGKVKINLHELDLTKVHDAWYFLQPRDNAKSPKTDLGSLRLTIDYISDHVISSCYYDPLRNLILQSPDVDPIASSAAYVLGEIVSNKLDAAQPLVKVFLHHGQIVHFINHLAKWEIAQVTDRNTIFRGNTLGSKCIDEFMKLTGLHYLKETLKSLVDLIFNEHKPCEIDPFKIKDGENLEVNKQNLRDYVDRILNAITDSALTCPPIMCQVFSGIRELASNYFPENKEVKYSVVSGFIFLRFFAPAILYPKLFELHTEQADAQTQRTLTLISKTLQSLGNFVSSKTPQQIFKEDYMESMYKDLQKSQTHIENVRKYLEIISSCTLISNEPSDVPVVLKEGMMIKRAQGRKKFGIKNFKRRYFCLTTQELLYAKAKGEEALCTIPIDNILAVEKLQEESFKMKYMFQVVQPQRALYLQASNCVEEKEWIDMLTKICQSNKNRLKEYHPAAFINGHWLCCKASNELERGCSPVSASVSPDIKVNIDSDREIERIYSLILENMSKLESLIDDCENQAVYTGEKIQLRPKIVDTQSLFPTLQSIQTCVMSLKQEHEQHIQSIFRQTKYGSEQAPIGDDNYLRMAAQTRLDNGHVAKIRSSISH